MTPDYTVIIPAYNAAGTLAESIESVLRQTLAPGRILVIDDGSTDATRAVAEAFDPRVEVFAQTNQGPGAAVSRGLRHSAAPLIAALDADDLWLPDKIEQQWEYLQRHPNCQGVFTRVRQFGETLTHEVIQDGWLRSTMLIRRAVYTCLGDVVDPPGRRGEMIDWLARAREAGFELALLPDVLVCRRVSPNSLSAGRNLDKDRGYAQVAISALRRKRARQTGASSI